jgi:hypothetical protein
MPVLRAKFSLVIPLLLDFSFSFSQLTTSLSVTRICNMLPSADWKRRNTVRTKTSKSIAYADDGLYFLVRERIEVNFSFLVTNVSKYKNSPEFRGFRFRSRVNCVAS